MRGRKRNEVGAICGSRPKRKKVYKQTLPEEEEGILVIKVSARTSVRPEVEHLVLPWFTKQTIEATKICELASLLLLNKVRAAHEESCRTNDWAFFDQGDGVHNSRELLLRCTEKVQRQ